MTLRIFIVSFLAMIGLCCCTDPDFDVNDFSDDKSITTLNGTWKVISFEDFSKEEIEFKNQTNSWGRDIAITFDDTKNPNRFDGKNATNDVAGEFVYVGTRQFKLERLGTTFVAQPEWADRFSEAVLDGDVTYKVSRTRLRMYYQNMTKSVTLEKL